ncbi:MAG: NADH-quinone oxidoreductase subunit N [Chloroflexaceae bacterium]|nr:NADH-quinone oxidoreductase subunit N [Chloroflexaceae bacterium]
MQFEMTDIPRILPEILLLVLGLLVVGSDIFERWATDEAAQRERSHSAAWLTLIGLGMIFIIALLQSGYIPGTQLAEDTPSNFFTNILRNLQSGGPNSSTAVEPILGAFATDHLTMLGRLIFIGAAFLTVLLTFDVRPSAHPAEFYGLLVCSTAGMCIMSGASELILAYLAVELTSIPLYMLAGYFRTDKRSTEAGMKYFLFGAVSSGVLLYGMSLTYGFVASIQAVPVDGNVLTQFSRIGQASNSLLQNDQLITLAVLFVIAGLGYKIAVVPFHGWSPDVYQGAPTPITAFLSTASKAAGFLLLYRLLVTAFPGLTGSASLASDATFTGWTSALALIALLTLIVGNLAALPQTNVKRLLAYSSIAHAGFVLMAMLAWASPQSIDRAIGTSSLIYYLVVYTVTNIGAFGSLAVIGLLTGGDDIKNLNGLARRNLGLAVLFAIFVLSLAGIPPLSGFLAKFYVFMAAWQSGATWLVVIGAITTIISLYYYLRLLRAMFMQSPTTTEPIKTPAAMNLSLVVACLLVVFLGVFPNIVLTLIDQVQLVAGL